MLLWGFKYEKMENVLTYQVPGPFFFIVLSIKRDWVQKKRWINFFKAHFLRLYFFKAHYEASETFGSKLYKRSD